MFFWGAPCIPKISDVSIYVCADGLYLITSIWNKHYIKQPTRAYRRRGIIPKRSIDRGVVFLLKNKSFPTAFARLCGISPALLP